MSHLREDIFWSDREDSAEEDREESAGAEEEFTDTFVLTRLPQAEISMRRSVNCLLFVVCMFLFCIFVSSF